MKLTPSNRLLVAAVFGALIWTAVSADVLVRIGSGRDWSDLAGWYNATTGAPATSLPADSDIAIVNRDRALIIGDGTDATAYRLVVNDDPAPLGTHAVVEVQSGGTLDAHDLHVASGGGRASLLVTGGDVRTSSPVRIDSPNGRFSLSAGSFTNDGTGLRELFHLDNAGRVWIAGGTFAASGRSAEDVLFFYGPDILIDGGQLLVTEGQVHVHQDTRMTVVGDRATIQLDRLNASYEYVAATYRFVLDDAGRVSPIAGQYWMQLDEATVIVDAARYGGGDRSIPLFEVTAGSLLTAPRQGVRVVQLPDGVSHEITVDDTESGRRLVLHLDDPDTDPPVAYDRIVSVGTEGPRPIYLPARDVDGDTLTYQYSQPTLGTVSGDGPVVTYTPASGSGTTDSFSFTASDGRSESNVATITLNVTDVPLSLTGLPADSAYVPETLDELWADYDPTVDPLDAEVFQSAVTADGITVQKVIFTIGTFETIAYGVETARLAAYYAYPPEASPENRLPAVVHIHGGGGRSDLDEVLYAARNGYVGLSVNWDGQNLDPAAYPDVDIEGLEFDPAHPNTDWGALRDMAGGVNYVYFTNFGPDLVADGTLDQVAGSPRNSGWFLTAIANRRALTFLQSRPEVDPERLAVRGFSMGGVQTTVLAGVDGRLSAANPSVGGAGEITQARKDEIGLPGFQVTEVSPAYALSTPITAIPEIDIPILYTGPTNDFAAPMDNLMYNWSNILPTETPRRFAVPPRGNHENPPSTDVNSMLWFDQHLKGSYVFPEGPQLTLDYATGSVRAILAADTAAATVTGVDIYYSIGDYPLYRYWRPCERVLDHQDGTWTGDCVDIVEGQNLFVYGVVSYAFDDTTYTTVPLRAKGDPDNFNGEDPYSGEFILSSNLQQVAAEVLADAGVQFRPEGTRTLVHDFSTGWDDWLLPNGWSNPFFWYASSRKVWDPRYRPAPDAALSLDVRVAGTKSFFIVAWQSDPLFHLGPLVPPLFYYAGVQVTGDGSWQTITLNRSDFRPSVASVDSLEALFPGLYPDIREPLESWDTILAVSLESNIGGASIYEADGTIRVLPGSSWEVGEREFRDLRWSAEARHPGPKPSGEMTPPLLLRSIMASGPSSGGERADG